MRCAMSSFNAKKLLRKVLARADADGSGELDADELKLVLQAMGQKNPDMDAVMKEVDADGSGEVDKEEFEAWCAPASSSAARQWHRSRRHSLRSAVIAPCVLSPQVLRAGSELNGDPRCAIKRRRSVRPGDPGPQGVHGR